MCSGFCRFETFSPNHWMKEVQNDSVCIIFVDLWLILSTCAVLLSCLLQSFRLKIVFSDFLSPSVSFLSNTYESSRARLLVSGNTGETSCAACGRCRQRLQLNQTPHRTPNRVCRRAELAAADWTRYRGREGAGFAGRPWEFLSHHVCVWG